MKSMKMLKFFFITFILALYVVLFVSITPNDPQTKSSFKLGNSYINLFNLKGYSTFKKGLDIAGGVELTYKVDFSKYREIYKDDVEYNKMKNQAVEIILTNIDNRISKLGVSDYSSNLETINGEDYIIVEIGGLKDIQQGKEIIGKTVELEFKLPYELVSSESTESDRELIAQDLLKAAVQNPALFEQLGDSKIMSDDIYYNNYTQLPSYLLPAFYKDLGEKVGTNSGSVVIQTLKEVDYDGQYLISSMDQDEINYYFQSLSSQNYEPVSGWLITKFNGLTKSKVETLDEIKFQEIAKQFNLQPEIEYSKEFTDQKEQTYTFVDGNIKYLSSSLFSGENAYDVNVYSIGKTSSLGATPEVINAENERVTNIVNQIKSSINNNEAVNLTGVVTLLNGWNGEQTIKDEIVTFKLEGDSNILTFDELNNYYVVQIKDSKSKDQNLYKYYNINGIDSSINDSLKEALDYDTLYDIQDILVAKSPKWIAAKDSKSGKILNGAYFNYAGVTQDNVGRPAVQVNFNDEGKEIFCNITKEYIKQRMAIFVGGKLVTSPTIQDEICGGAAIINGDYTIQEAKQMTQDLNEGALPAKLIPSHEEKVSPTLGEAALNGAIISSIFGLIFILVLMIYFYGFKLGFISIISLLTYLTILLALLKLIGYSLSLSGIAAIILCIGMGVDANVLIFERLKEELKSGKDYQTAIIDGYERSWPAIRDGNFTTFFIGLLLLVIGTNLFKGFGTMLIINIILTLVIIVPVTKAYLILFYKKN